MNGRVETGISGSLVTMAGGRGPGGGCQLGIRIPRRPVRAGSIDTAFILRDIQQRRIADKHKHRRNVSHEFSHNGAMRTVTYPYKCPILATDQQ